MRMARDSPGLYIRQYRMTEAQTMSEPTTHLLREMTDALVQAVQPRQVLVFGSRARGEAGADSDVDLLVVEDEPFGRQRSRRAELRRIRRALASFRVPKDILVYSHAEVQHWRHSRNHIIGKAYREGSVLYGDE